MKIALTTLAIIIGLCDSDVLAQSATTEKVRSYELAIGKHSFGIADYEWRFDMGDRMPTDTWTMLRAGRLGDHRAPFNARQGAMSVGLILGMISVVVTALTLRWRKGTATV